MLQNGTGVVWRVVAIAILMTLAFVLLRQGYVGGDGWINAYFGELNSAFGVDLFADVCASSANVALSWAACQFKPVLLAIGFFWIAGIISIVFWR